MNLKNPQPETPTRNPNPANPSDPGQKKRNPAHNNPSDTPPNPEINPKKPIASFG